MACLEHVCKESEYEARDVDVESAKCTSGSGNSVDKDEAIETAKTKLSDDVKAQSEKIDTCTDDKNCVCGVMSSWPAPPGEGWREINKGLRRVYEKISAGNLSTGGGYSEWTVTLSYNRYYRSRSADCFRKPLLVEGA